MESGREKDIGIEDKKQKKKRDQGKKGKRSIIRRKYEKNLRRWCANTLTLLFDFIIAPYRHTLASFDIKHSMISAKDFLYYSSYCFRKKNRKNEHDKIKNKNCIHKS